VQCAVISSLSCSLLPNSPVSNTVLLLPLSLTRSLTVLCTPPLILPAVIYFLPANVLFRLTQMSCVRRLLYSACDRTPYHEDASLFHPPL
jgi:hypothetical protein